MHENNTILDIRNLKKYFKTQRGNLHAVDGLSFKIGMGKTLGIVGESGCGKSTLGRTILGLLKATDGTVVYKGNDITYLKGAERKKLYQNMQMIFQDPYSSLNPRMYISRLIAEPLANFRICASKKERMERVASLMETVGLAPRLAYSYPHELDGGRKQRIVIARALSVDPDFIVCDEPVSALDVSIQAQVLNILMDLQEQRGLTYIFITHDLSVVRHISDEILVMYLGCLVEKCESKELFKQPLHPYTKGLLSAIPVPSIHGGKARTLIEGEIGSPINPKPGCRFVSRCTYASEICSHETPVIEEPLPNHFSSCHRVREINGL